MRTPLPTWATVPALLCLVVLTACGGGGGSDSPDEPAGSGSASGSADQPLVGTYDVESVVDRTTLSGKGNTKGTKDELTLVIGCLDEGCEQLATRGSLTRGALSRTIVLDAGVDGAAGDRTRTGPCTQTPNKKKAGSYTEKAAYRWTVDGDELSGEVDYTFTGCGFDGDSHLKVTGDRVSDTPSYLASAEVDPLAGPVTEYDDAVGALYAGFGDCYGKTTAKTSACVVALLEDWSGTFDDAIGALTGVGDPSEVCGKAIDETDLAGLQKKVSSTVRGLKRSGAAQQKALDKAVPALVTALTTEHQDLVTALALCVDPADTDALGDDGKLAVDVDSRLPLPTG